MPSKRCPKCDHLALFDGEPPTACPACGAVYSKVEAALKAGAVVRPPPLSAPAAAEEFMRAVPPRMQRAEADHSSDRFIDSLRRDSVYPTFRAVVRIGYWLVIVLMGVAVVLAIVLNRGALAIVGSITAFAITFIFLSFAREATLMLADLSDAAVRIAERLPPEQS